MSGTTTLADDLARRLTPSRIATGGESFRDYMRRVAPHIKHYKHLIAVADTLQAVADGEIKRLMLFMPPRHGKSETVSRLFTSYYLHRFPHRSVGLASYSSDLAGELSGDARDYFVSAGGQLHPSTYGKRKWRTLSGGQMWSAGVSGSITGKGADLAIIDDPLKGAEEALSPRTREKLWQWYTTVFQTRLEPDAAVIVLMTRWHEADLAGKILEHETEDPEGWHVLRLPALYGVDIPQDDELPETVTDLSPEYEWRTKAWEALNPERYPTSRLRKIRARMGRFFTALFQQRPVPASGNHIKRWWFRYWVPEDRRALLKKPVTVPDITGELRKPVMRLLPSGFDAKVVSWDLAFKGTESSNRVSGQVWARRGPDFYILDNDTRIMDFSASLLAIRNMHHKHRDAYGVIIEDKANGPAVINTLQDEIPGLIPSSPVGSKESRLIAQSYLVQSGNLYLPHPDLYPWVEGFISEWINFPGGAYDDQVDAGTQALADLATGTSDLPSLIGRS